jgi:TonB family protein
MSLNEHFKMNQLLHHEMKNIRILLVLLLICQYSFCQEIIEKNYYKNKWGEPATSEKSAKIYGLTIREKDSTIRNEMRNISNDKLIRLWSYKDGMPVGKWISYNGEEFNYDFELTYTEKEYDGFIKYDIKNKALTQTSGGNFEPPNFPFEENNFQAYVAKRLVYPIFCVENGIQGRITFQFVIDEAGKLMDLSVIKSADKNLDKEAARVIREAPDWIPAKLNGQPIKISTTMQIVFVLQQ